MKQRVMSIVLVASMLMGNLSASVPVFATETDDGIQISTETGSDGIVMDETESDIVIDESTDADIEIKQEQMVSASVSAGDIKETLSAGKDAKLEVKAENATEEPAVLRVYFCDIGKEMSEDKTEWGSYLTQPSMSMKAKGLDADFTMKVKVQMADGSSKEMPLQFLKTVEGSKVTSRYAYLELPSGASSDFTISVTSEEAATIAVIPVMEHGSQKVYGAADSVKWEESISIVNIFKDIVVGDKESDITVDEVQAAETEEGKDILVETSDILIEDTEDSASEESKDGTSEDEKDTDEKETQESGTEDVEKADADDTEKADADDTEKADADDTEKADVDDTETSSGDIEIDADAEDGIEVQEGQTQEFSMERTKGTEDLDAAQFATARLVILTEDEDVIVDKEHILAKYDTLYLLQYDGVEQAMNAYVYYKDKVTAVEPDAAIETAANDGIEMEAGTAPTEITGMTVTEEENPVAVLSDEEASKPAQNESKVIALIDTGAMESANVIDRVSLIDDVLVGGTHGDDMVNYIVEENPDAKILSIRALGNDGYGSVSAVVSGIEYAINSKVDIINLSMYSKKTLSTSVLEAEIEKAIDSGITVVGSAGNDGADVANYVPGSIESIYTIGAVDADGVLQKISNYGELVDYYVVSTSTSEAAARFSGYISANGLLAADSDETGLIFMDALEDSYVNDDIVIKDETTDTEKTDETIYDPVIENYVKQNVDHSYVGEGTLDLVNVIDVNTTIAAEEDLNPGETIDTLMADGGDFRFLTQQVAMVPVYQFSEDSDYFVAFADLMHNDKRATIIDSALAHDNVYGETIEGYHLDTDTGLMYIPKEAFYGEDGTYYFQYLKAQILYSISGYSMESQWNSAAFTTTEEESGETETAVHGDNIFMQAMTVQVGKYMDVNNMLVTVNGFPIDGELYAYDSSTGMLTVGFSSAAVQSIWVQAEKGEDAPEVEPGLKAAAGAIEGVFSTPVSFSDMNFVYSKPISAQIDKIVKNYSIKSNARLIYPEGSSAHSGVNAGGTKVFAYRGELYSENSTQGKIVNWIVRGGSTNVTYGGKVYNAAWDAIYPFALKLATIDDEYIDFDELPYDLHLILECTHVNQSIGAAFGTSSWQTGTVQLRCIESHKNSDGSMWAVFGVYTSQCVGQHGLGFFRIYLQPKTGSLKLTKRLVNAEFSSKSSRIWIDTEFGLYKDKTCKKLYTNDTFDGKIALKDTTRTKYAVSKTISGIDPGTYYLKEIGRCPGTIQNTTVYKVTIKAGTPTTKYVDMDSGETLTYVPNYPFRGRFKILKTDEASGEPLAGAVFRVQYYGKERTSSSQKADATWYFKSGEDGVAGYREKDYLASWKNPDTGKTVKSSDPITITNGNWWLPQGYLYVKEIYAPDGYEVSEKEYTAEIKADSATQSTNGVWTNIYCPTVEIKIGDLPSGDIWRVRVNAKKINATSQGLEGAIFGVYTDEMCTNDSWVGDLTSGPNGTTDILTVDEIPVTQEEITVYMKEIEAPIGYTPTDEIFSLTFTKDKYDELKAAGDESGELKTFGPEKGIVNDEGWRVRVNAKKIDSDGNSLAGAVIGVYRDTACTEEVGRLTSEADGMTNILTVGAPLTQDTLDLYAREISAPEGYVISNKIYHLSFTKAEHDKLVAAGDETGELKTFGVDDMLTEDDGKGDGIVNDKGWQVQVQLKKIDQDGEPVSGAVFGVYADSVCTDEVGTLTSGSDGMSNVLTVSVPSSTLSYTLYCREKSAPEGYTASTEVFELTFEKEAYDKLYEADKNTKGELKQFNDGEGIVNEKEPEEPTPTPPPVEPSGAGVYVVKTSTAADEIMDLDSYTLEGAEFSVTSNRGFSGTLTTDANGISNQLSLPDDSWWEYFSPVYDKDGNYLYTPDPVLHTVTYTYTVRETKAPDGHLMNNQAKSFTVTMPYDKNKTIKLDFEDEPYFCDDELEIEKLGTKGEPIKGAVFKVEFFDASSAVASKLKKTWYLESDANGMIKMDDAHVSTRKGYKSDPFFMHKGKIVIPIDGYLQLTEVSVPAEYELDDTPFGFTTEKTANLSKRFYNELQRCRIRLAKYGADGTTPLPGVEFELKFLEESITATANKNPYFDRLLEEGESIIYSSDDSGNVVFENLDQGKYQITEVKTAPGQTLLKEPIIVTLPMEMTDEEADSYGNVDFSTANFNETYTDTWFFYDCLYEITNTATFVVPTTGGVADIMTFLPLIGGMGIFGGIGAVGLRRRKKK